MLSKSERMVKRVLLESRDDQKVKLMRCHIEYILRSIDSTGRPIQS